MFLLTIFCKMSKMIVAKIAERAVRRMGEKS